MTKKVLFKGKILIIFIFVCLFQTIAINKSSGQTVLNDECTGALSLIADTTCLPFSGTTYGATASSGSLPTSVSCYETVDSGDVWFSFQATGPLHIITLSNVAATNTAAFYYLTGLKVYSGSCGVLTLLGCDFGVTSSFSSIDATITLPGLTAGQTYYIRVWEEVTFNSSFAIIPTGHTFDICVTKPPTGSICDDPLIVNTVPYTFSGNTADYGDFYDGSPGANNCSSTDNYLNGNDVIFSYTASANGSIDISLNNIGDELAGMFVYQNCAAIGINCLAGVTNGSSATGDLNISTFNVVANTTYYIVVSTKAPPQTTTFTLVITGTAPLPVKMDALSGQLTSGNIARLSWNTFSEQNNKGFEIQRSADGKTFKPAAFVVSKANAGNSSEQIGYSYTDRAVVSSAVYYRLQQTDMDGKTAYSNIVRLINKENGGFNVIVAPNPVKNSLTVNTYGVPGKDAKVCLADITGKIVETIIVNGAETVIDMKGLPQGMYLVKYMDAEHNQTIKVSKQE